MKWRVVIAAVSALLSGCTGSRAQPSPLQRFAALRGPLQQVTNASRAEARRDRLLAGALPAADPARTRRAASALGRQSATLDLLSAAVAGAVRPLVRAEPNGPGRTYLTLIVSTLGYDRREAAALQREARLVGSDPWLIEGRDLHLQGQYDWQARRSAAAAVRLTLLAQQVRRRHPAAFQYVPVAATTTPT